MIGGFDDSLIGRFEDWEKGIDGGQMLEAGFRAHRDLRPGGKSDLPATLSPCQASRSSAEADGGLGIDERMGLVFLLREWRRLSRWKFDQKVRAFSIKVMIRSFPVGSFSYSLSTK